MMRVQWAPLAIDRLAEIAAYIAEDNPVAAEKWIREGFARAGIGDGLNAEPSHDDIGLS